MALIDHTEKFQLFNAVYEHRNMRKAATALNMTQPPLSYAIKQLEEDLQVSLFIRSKKGVEPTVNADLLYKYSKKMLKELNQLEFEVKSPQDEMAGVISVGTYDSIARYFGPEILNESAKSFPNLRLRLSSHRSGSNINLLIAGELDYSILVEPPESSNSNLMEKIPLYSDTYGLFIKENSDNNLKNFIYVADAFAGKGLTLQDLLKTHLKGYQELRLDSFEVCRELIKKGVGIGVLPNRVAEDDLKKGLIKRVKLKGFKLSKFGKHTIYECYLNQGKQRAKVLKFSKLVKDLLI